MTTVHFCKTTVLDPGSLLWCKRALRRLDVTTGPRGAPRQLDERLTSAGWRAVQTVEPVMMNVDKVLWSCPILSRQSYPRTKSLSLFIYIYIFLCLYVSVSLFLSSRSRLWVTPASYERATPPPLFAFPSFSAYRTLPFFSAFDRLDKGNQPIFRPSGRGTASNGTEKEKGRSGKADRAGTRYFFVGRVKKVENWETPKYVCWVFAVVSRFGAN